MPFAPAIPFSGLTGLRFIERTFDRQFETFNKSPDVQREIDNFLEKAGSITSVEELTGDRRLLGVVLGAFGLDDDINKGAFIRKVLEEGATDDRAFANRLVEPAYREMAGFLGFDIPGGTLLFEGTRTEIVERYRERQFELSVGEIDLDMRLAMNFKREAERVASADISDKVGWLRMLGSTPMRRVVEAGLNLPAQFALIDIDQQVEEVEDRARALFGTKSPKAFLDPENIDKMIERFMLNQQIRNGGISSNTPGSTALTLLQSSGLGASAQANLFASNF